MASPNPGSTGRRTGALATSVRRRRGILMFVRSGAGMAAAEVALLALLFIGMGLMVARILKPGIKAAATNLNSELAGGVSH